MDIESVVAQLRQEVRTIEAAIAALVGLGQTAPRRGRPPKSVQIARTPKKQRMSAAARRRIGLAKKRWWAQQHIGTAAAKKAAPAAAKKSSGGRKGLTAAGRKKLSALMKARWAARKKQ